MAAKRIIVTGGTGKAGHGIRKVVLGSSESSYGICFANEFFEPRYLPVDEFYLR